MNPKILQETLKSKLGVWTAVFLGLWIIGGAGIYGVFIKKIGGLDAENKALELRIRETQNFKALTPDVDQVLDKQQQEVSLWAQKTLKPGEHAKVVSAVAEATKAKGIVISSLKPVFSEKKEKARQENRRILPAYFELKMQCRYQQLGEFFEYLESLPLLLSVNSYSAVAIALKPGAIEADITLTAYEESLL